MSDLTVILFATIGLIVLYVLIEHTDYHNTPFYILCWILAQPIYWAILILIFNRRGI